MPTIRFRAKAEKVWHADRDEVAYTLVKVPEIKRQHCDMDEWRRHPKFGGLANSDLFPGVLRRQTQHLGTHIRLDRIPAGVTVDTSGFLVAVAVDVP